VNVIFPKLLQGQIDHHEKANSSNEDIFCYCRKKEFGKMILCDNPNFRYGWFHFPCVNLTTEPIGSWFCDDCYHA
jgi:chromatin modification-related protein YNG2